MKSKHSDSSQVFKLKSLKFGNFMCVFSNTFSQQAITTTIRHKKLAEATTYSFEVDLKLLHLVDIMSARIVHGLMQRKAIKYNLRSKQIKIESKLIPMHVQYALKTNTLMPRKQLQEIFRHLYFFIKKEEGWITGMVLSLKYQPSLRQSVGLEISLILKLNLSKFIAFLKMK